MISYKYAIFLFMYFFQPPSRTENDNRHHSLRANNELGILCIIFINHHRTAYYSNFIEEKLRLNSLSEVIDLELFPFRYSTLSIFLLQGFLTRGDYQYYPRHF